ncbi:molybdate ABC transporter substrate-binding protein [Nisaea denitrificans]|uniref:molybdate ABC transporter substrate-binding protein n=1 Tax=Nisaea denitrificans TaxID=390877 RepID=UPI0009FC0BCD|nr:molybdate ABC transporter substrate-binding protein [Nisaea denitrificans]
MKPRFSRRLTRQTLSLLAGLVIAIAGAVSAHAAEATIAVAANFASTADKLAKAFKAESGETVVIANGSTGQIYAQIRQGAPFDAFLAADQARPALLHKDGTAARAPFTYATGRLALWSPDPATIPEDGAAFLSLAELERISIANPKLAPYGVAAKESLTALGLWQTYEKRIVMGQNIAQAFQIVAAGGAPAGFVALSQLLAAPDNLRGSHWAVPANLHTPIRQDAVLLKRGANNTAAEGFLAFLTSPAGCAAIRDAGYQPPDACK